jgi:hypothetical protein
MMKEWRVRVIKTVSPTGFIKVTADDYSVGGAAAGAVDLNFMVRNPNACSGYDTVVLLPRGTWLAVEELANPPTSYIDWGYVSIDEDVE